MRKLSIIFLFLTSFLYADVNITDHNSSLHLETHPNAYYVADIKNKIAIINTSLKDNVWMAKFSSFLNYQELVQNLNNLEKELKKTSVKEDKKIDDLSKKIKITKEQLLLLKEYETSPFASLIQPPDIGETQRVNNPFSILSGFSYIKHIQLIKNEYYQRIQSLEILIDKLEQKEQLYKALSEFDSNDELKRDMYNLRYELGEFKSARDISLTTFAVYEKRVNEEIHIVTNDIKMQIKRALNIALMILFVLVLSFLIKYLAKKYIKDNERFYIANKIINIINFTLIILILLLAYIENVTYVITVLGFASAGIAIAMKDMFMSMLGWMVIVFGGAFHVGDRIRVRKVNGDCYVGDIIDISFLRITIYEDITLTTWKLNRRAGRIIFIPNNYIFTELISNYTHSGMKTVWDGIDILLTFDSNHKKAMYIIKNITRKYSKGYTDIAKKQMTKLRSQYSIKNPNVEPRIFSFFEPYGIQISIWYMTNAHATLALRSNISSEILEALNYEDDITIAYPTQTLYRGTHMHKSLPHDMEKVTMETLF